MKWKWLAGTATSYADFGSPLGTTDYAFCLYDANGLALAAIVPANEAWKGGPTGFKYKSKTGTHDGVTQIQLRTGGDGKARIAVQGKGIDLATVAALEQPLRIQLQNSDGPCWEAVYSAPPRKHVAGIFSDRAD